MLEELLLFNALQRLTAELGRNVPPSLSMASLSELCSMAGRLLPPEALARPGSMPMRVVDHCLPRLPLRLSLLVSCSVVSPLARLAEFTNGRVSCTASDRDTGGTAGAFVPGHKNPAAVSAIAAVLLLMCLCYLSSADLC